METAQWLNTPLSCQSFGCGMQLTLLPIQYLSNLLQYNIIDILVIFLQYNIIDILVIFCDII